MRLLLILPVLFLIGCRLPDRWVTGTYVNREGDTLKIKTTRSFRVEVMDPDTVEKKQLKFTSGRWHQEKRKLYLTIATESMGDYWSCVPMKVSLRHLKRPVECTEGKGKKMNFKKVHVKKKKKKDKKKKNKEKTEEV